MIDPEIPERSPAQENKDSVEYRLLSKDSTIEDDAVAKTDFRSSSSHPIPDGNAVSASGLRDVTRYELVGLLGQGAVGQVFAANDGHLERSVALKVLHLQSQHDSNRVEKFVNEARIMAGLEHPNILPVYDLDRSPGGISFFTMRRAQGMTLSEAITRLSCNDNPPQEIVSLNGRLNIFQKVLDAVSFAHHKGVLHHDLKPENIMLGQFGEVLVLDWGTAVDRNRSKPRENALFGTPVYMSPEQARREPIDERSDVYALGATLFQLLTLRYVTLTMEEKLFWEMKRKGQIDSFTEAEQTAIPEALREIVLRALAPGREQRWSSVQAFRDAIHDFQSHAESLGLAASARVTLEDAIEHQDYDRFIRSKLAFEQALTLWGECPQAREGLSDNRLRHCECALNKGDLKLAESLVDKGDYRHKPALIRLEQARNAEALQRRRTRYIQSAAALLVVVLLGMSGYLVVDSMRYYGKWQVVFDRDFTEPGATFDGLSYTIRNWLNDYIPPQLGPKGAPLKSGDLVWYKMPAHATDIQVEVSIRWPETVDGFDIYLDTAREDCEHFWLTPAGYMCQVGGYKQDLCFQSTSDHSRSILPIRVTKVEMHPGTTYRVMFQKIGEELSLWVDGKQIQQRFEMLPLHGKDFNWIAMRGWTNIELRRLTVKRRAMPEKTSPLVAGDALITHGEIEKAVTQYREIASDFPGTPIGELALAKAFMSANALSGTEPLREAIIGEFARTYPDSHYLTALNEAACVGLWRDEKYKEVCRRLGQILSKEPDSCVILQMLDGEHHTLPDEVQTEFLNYVAKSRVPQIDLSFLGLKDIKPLSDARFSRLILRNNLLTDITPLSGMPLTYLDVSENLLNDLEPVRNMPLTIIDCHSNKISSLSPLIGLALTNLNCSSNKIKKLIPIPTLTHLTCSQNPIESLEPVRGSKLNSLSISNTQITDLTPVRGLPIEVIELSFTKINQITALSGMKLRQISAANTLLSSLEVLRGMPLVHINIDECKNLSSLEALQGIALQYLSCVSTPIKVLDPLAKCSTLRILNVPNTGISSLEALHGLSLSVLQIDGNPITSLEPLKGMPLLTLYCSDCPITSLEPLRQSPIGTLRCTNTQLQSVTPFEMKPPQSFLFEGPAFSHDQMESIMSRWENIPGQKPNVIRNQTLRFIREKAFDRLRSLAFEFEGHHYLTIDQPSTFAQANEIAQAARGHLVTIPNRRVNEMLARIGMDLWIGLVPGENGKLKWANRAPLTFTNYFVPLDRDKPGPWALLGIGVWSGFWPDSHTQFVIEWDD